MSVFFTEFLSLHRLSYIYPNVWLGVLRLLSIKASSFSEKLPFFFFSVTFFHKIITGPPHKEWGESWLVGRGERWLMGRGGQGLGLLWSGETGKRQRHTGTLFIESSGYRRLY